MGDEVKDVRINPPVMEAGDCAHCFAVQFGEQVLMPILKTLDERKGLDYACYFGESLITWVALAFANNAKPGAEAHVAMSLLEASRIVAEQALDQAGLTGASPAMRAH